MSAWMIGVVSILMSFGLMVIGVKVGRRMQRERCGCDAGPLGMDTGGCGCGGSCGCGH